MNNIKIKLKVPYKIATIKVYLLGYFYAIKQIYKSEIEQQYKKYSNLWYNIKNIQIVIF